MPTINSSNINITDLDFDQVSTSLKEYLKEKYNLYDVTKKQPCENRYFTSNKRIKFIMRGNNNEV